MATWQVFQADAGDYGVTRNGAVVRRGLKSEAAARGVIRQARSAGDRTLGAVERLTITGPAPAEVSAAFEVQPAEVAFELEESAPVVEVSIVVEATEEAPASFDPANFLSDLARDVIAAIESGAVDEHLADVAKAEAGDKARKSVFAAIEQRRKKLGA